MEPVRQPFFVAIFGLPEPLQGELLQHDNSKALDIRIHIRHSMRSCEECGFGIPLSAIV